MKKVLTTLVLALAVILLNVLPAMAAEEPVEACFVVGTDSPAELKLHLFFKGEVAGTVTGEAVIGDELESDITGHYISPLFRGAPYEIITAEGYPHVHFCPLCGVGPQLIPNIKDLGINTLSNTAGYEYSVEAGKYMTVKDAPVKEVSCSDIK